MSKRDETAPRVVYAEIVDSDGLNESEGEQGEEEPNEDSLVQAMPVRRKRKLPQEPDTTQLTRHFSLTREFPPLYTGGKFMVIKERAFALNDCKVSIFNVRSGEHLFTLSEDNEEVISFAVSQNEKYIATTNKTFMTRVYLLQQLTELGSVQQSIQSFKTPNQMCLEVCFDPSNRFVAVGTADSHVKVFDVEKGFQTHNFIGHRGVIVQLAFMPGADSLKLISAAEDFNVKVWDMVLNKEVASCKGNKGRVTSIQFTNDHKTLIVGARDGRIALYNTTDKFKQMHVLSLIELGLDEEEVTCMQYVYVSQTKSLLVIGGSKGQLCAVDLATLRIVYKETGFVASELAYIGLLENQIVSCNTDQNLFTYNLTSSSKLVKVSSRCLYLDEVIEIKVFKPLNQYALLCSNSETLKLMHLTTGDIELYNGHSDIILCLDIAHSQGFCLSGAKDNTVMIWGFDLQASFQQKLQCRAKFIGHSQNITSVYFAPKRCNFFASVGQDNTLKVWPIPKQTTEVQEITAAQMTIMAHQKYINCCRVSPNDKVIATSSQDKQIKLWDSTSLSLKATLVGHKKGVWDIQFNPSEQMLVSASGDNDLKVWNLTTNQCVSTLQGHKQALVKVVWLNTGLQLASASVDGIVKVWNVSRQQCLNSFEMHEEKIWALDFSESESQLMMVTGGSDSKVKVWADNTLEEELKIKQEKLGTIADEQLLSKLLRENDLTQAALLAFRLKRVRDFFHVANRIVNGTLVPPRAFIPGLMLPGVAHVVQDRNQDPIDAILLSRKSFQQALDTNTVQINTYKGVQELRKVVSLMLKEADLVQLMELVRKLNARQEYARLAQLMLAEVMARVDVDTLPALLKKQGKGKLWGDIMEACEIYGLKHYARADKNLKQSYFLQYVMSQITLQADSVQPPIKKRDAKHAAKANLF